MTAARYTRRSASPARPAPPVRDRHRQSNIESAAAILADPGRFPEESAARRWASAFLLRDNSEQSQPSLFAGVA